jgi:hypothetical protein
MTGDEKDSGRTDAPLKSMPSGVAETPPLAPQVVREEVFVSGAQVGGRDAQGDPALAYDGRALVRRGVGSEHRAGLRAARRLQRVRSRKKYSLILSRMMTFCAQTS